MAKLAERYNTKCVVSEIWYRQILLANFNPEFFTDIATPEHFLFGKNRGDLSNDYRNLNEDKDAMLMVSGWGIGNKSRKNYFKVGYSSHSSPSELLEFVSYIHPKQISFHSAPDTDGAK